MQLSSVLLSILAATGASAAPTSEGSGKSCAVPARKFNIMSLRSASPIHFGQAGATQNKLVLNLPEDKADAQCTNGETRRDATFYIKDGELFLYGGKDKVQQFFVDRSGMGQGVMQYFTKGEGGIPRNGETKGWAVDENDNLSFNGAGLLACPSANNTAPWYVWVSAGINQPAGQQGCLGFSARTLTAATPVQCTYSNYSA
ncbi:hypothetical protein QBC35DRAFT_432460 [Podospora australis]|uniref:Cell wall protein PhiA n=1 Tax=Podospora australis TaxID=1536484 RepID=A0AAN6WV63_9PEZI|nr:hypothetical protein QBC35DRAFT_432460 [Podospora australis]